MCLLRVMSIIRRFSSIMDSYKILSFWFGASLCLYCCYFSINIVPLPLKEVNYVNEEIYTSIFQKTIAGILLCHISG